MGLIAEAKGETSKRFRRAADEGRSHLEENSDEIEELIERLEGHGRSAAARVAPRRWAGRSATPHVPR